MHNSPASFNVYASRDTLHIPAFQLTNQRSKRIHAPNDQHEAPTQENKRLDPPCHIFTGKKHAISEPASPLMYGHCGRVGLQRSFKPQSHSQHSRHSRIKPTFPWISSCHLALKSATWISQLPVTFWPQGFPRLSLTLPKVLPPQAGNPWGRWQPCCTCIEHC